MARHQKASSTSALEEFAAGRAILPVDVLHKLTKEIFPEAIFDAKQNVLRNAPQPEPKLARGSARNRHGRSAQCRVARYLVRLRRR